jgi:hypothetical protein
MGSRSSFLIPARHEVDRSSEFHVVCFVDIKFINQVIVETSSHCHMTVIVDFDVSSIFSSFSTTTSDSDSFTKPSWYGR